MEQSLSTLIIYNSSCKLLRRYTLNVVLLQQRYHEGNTPRYFIRLDVKKGKTMSLSINIL